MRLTPIASRIMLIATLLGATPAIADVYVVVAKTNTQKLTLEEAQAYFKLEKTEWPDGKKVILAMPEMDSPEGEAMLAKIYDFSKEKYKKFWLERVFRGIVPSPPETKSGDALKEFLKSYPMAIGIMQGKLVDGGVTKVVKLD